MSLLILTPSHIKHLTRIADFGQKGHIHCIELNIIFPFTDCIVIKIIQIIMVITIMILPQL